MTIEHSSIVDAQRHEPKHASTAAANTVNTANGDGSTRYDFVTWANITSKPTSNAYLQVLSGASTASSQQPSATNTALQVEFGPGGSSASVSLSSAGVLTFLQAGYYLVQVYYEAGRTGTTSNAILFHRAMYNSAQLGSSDCINLSAAVQTIPVYKEYLIQTNNPTDTMLFQILRDAAGNNDGGLISTTTSASGWATAPSARIIVSKFQGLQ